MKSILISIKPEWVAKILNGEKTIEVRKTAPKCELPIDVYIYCTKGNHIGYLSNRYVGKVVAKFTLNKIENFINGMNELEREWDGKPDAEYDYFAYEKALEKACLTYEEADKYCPDQSFYAWHISDLEIFDEPKELSEFYSLRLDKDITKLFDNSIQLSNGKWVKRLSNPPQSYCFVEVD